MNNDLMPVLIKNVIAKIKKNFSLLPDENRNIQPLVRIESYLATQRLLHLLDQVIGSNELADKETLEFLLSFLSDRWDEVEESDAIYPHTPNSLANQYCLIVAQELEEFFHEHPYFLIMPILKSIRNNIIREKLRSLKLHEFVFSDDGWTPIEIVKCLDQANHNKTTILYFPDNATLQLNENEANRVINHCGESVAYYGAMEYRQDHHTHAFDKDIDKLSVELHQTLETNSPFVKASYGEKGKKKLIKSIIKQIKHPRQFIQAMQVLNKFDWRILLNDIYDEDLSEMIIGNDLLLNCVQRESFCVNNESYNKALLYCFAEIYIRQRKKMGDVNLNIKLPVPHFSKNKITEYAGKWFDRYGKTWLGGYTMNEKLLAARELQQFLISDKPFNELRMSIDKTLHGPLFEGDLGMIAQQVERLGLNNLQYAPNNRSHTS